MGVRTSALFLIVFNVRVTDEGVCGLEFEPILRARTLRAGVELSRGADAREIGTIALLLRLCRLASFSFSWGGDSVDDCPSVISETRFRFPSAGLAVFGAGSDARARLGLTISVGGVDARDFARVDFGMVDVEGTKREK